MTAWCLRRYVLSCLHPDVRPGAWRFLRTPAGEPRLAHPYERLSLEHSLSHGGLYAAVIIAHAACGIDVDRVCGSIADLDGALTREEAQAVAASSAPDDRFLVYWTVKEAVLKMAGTGLSAPPSSVRVRLREVGSPEVEIAPPLSPTLQRNLQIMTWPLPEGHRLAAAYQAEAGWPAPSLREWAMPA